MPVGIIGQKCGMTRVFTEQGESIPVTVIEVKPHRVTQIKNSKGHRALQVTRGEIKRSRLTKPELGHFAKANVEPGRGLWEFKLADNEYQDVKVGDEFGVELFDEGQYVDVTATSRGHGFSGVVKRWNFHMQDATHGNSLSHRAPGSIGQCQTPGRVFKGKKMAGQYGNKRITVQSQEIVRVDTDRNFMLLKGTVPGAPGGNVVVLPAVKKAAPPVKAVLREAKAEEPAKKAEEPAKTEEKVSEGSE